jgi:hypothetical protein
MCALLFDLDPLLLIAPGQLLAIENKQVFSVAVFGRIGPIEAPGENPTPVDDGKLVVQRTGNRRYRHGYPCLLEVTYGLFLLPVLALALVESNGYAP